MFFTYLILLAGFIIGTIEWQWIISKIQDKIRWGRIGTANYWYEKHRETIDDAGSLLYSWPCRISRGLVGLLVIAARTATDPYHGWQSLFVPGRTPLSRILTSGIDKLTDLITRTTNPEHGDGFIYLLVAKTELVGIANGLKTSRIYIILISLIILIALSLLFSLGISAVAIAAMPELMIAVTILTYVIDANRCKYTSKTFNKLPCIIENTKASVSVRKERNQKKKKLKECKKQEGARIKRVNAAAKKEKHAIVRKREPLSDAVGRLEDAQDDFVGEFYTMSELDVELFKADPAFSMDPPVFQPIPCESFVQYPVELIDDIIKRTIERADIRSADADYVRDNEKQKAKSIRKKRLKMNFSFSFFGILKSLGYICLMPLFLGLLYLVISDYIYNAKRSHFWSNNIIVCIFVHVFVGVLVFFLLKGIIRIIARFTEAASTAITIYTDSNRTARRQTDNEYDVHEPFIYQYRSNRKEDNYNISARISELKLLRLLSGSYEYADFMILKDNRYTNVYYFFGRVEGKECTMFGPLNYAVRGKLFYKGINQEPPQSSCGIIKIDLLQHTIFYE